VLIYAPGSVDGGWFLQHDPSPEWTDATGEVGEEGVKTFLAFNSHGFPTCSSCPGRRAAADQFNFTRTIEGQTDYVAWLLKTSRGRGKLHRDISKQSRCLRRALPRSGFQDSRCEIACPITTGDGNAEPGSLPITGGRKNGTNPHAAQSPLSRMSLRRYRRRAPRLNWPPASWFRLNCRHRDQPLKKHPALSPSTWSSQQNRTWTY